MLNEWNKKKVILFDLDGTLTDPGIGITNSVMYALEKFGITVSDRSELYKFIGPPLMQSFEEYYGLDKGEAERAVALYREYFRDKGIFENQLFTGITELLKRLKAQKKMVVLATSKPEIYAVQILEHFQLDRYFDVVSGSMMNGERTDKGEVIAWAIQLIKEKREYTVDDMVMIGDREHDVIGAKKNHISSIGVLFGYGSEREFKESGADAVVSTVSELYEVLTGEAAGEV